MEDSKIIIPSIIRRIHDKKIEEALKEFFIFMTKNDMFHVVNETNCVSFYVTHDSRVFKLANTRDPRVTKLLGLDESGPVSPLWVFQIYEQKIVLWVDQETVHEPRPKIIFRGGNGTSYDVQFGYGTVDIMRRSVDYFISYFLDLIANLRCIEYEMFGDAHSKEGVC